MIWAQKKNTTSVSIFFSLSMAFDYFLQAGLWGIRIGAGPHLKGYSCLGRPGESLDYFHEKIAHEEFARLGLPGAVDGIVAGNVIGTPPIM